MAKGKPPPFQKKPAVPPPRGIGAGKRAPAKPNPFGKSKAPPFGKFASGGELRSVPVPPPREESPKRKPPEEEESFASRAKRALGMSGTPAISGGYSNLIKKRGEQIDEATGVRPVEKARGGRVHK